MSESTFLRRVLLVDGWLFSAGTGLAMIAGAGILAPLTQLPEALLRGAGLALLPFAALVLWTARAARPSPAAVWAIILINLAWAIESVVILAAGQVGPNPLGTAFVLAQAAAVAGIAALEYVGLKRMTAYRAV